jgi:hypothetical protein
VVLKGFRAILTVAVVAGIAAPASAQDTTVSLERIRQALAREPRLVIAVRREPDFRVKVEGREPFDMFSPTFDLGLPPPYWSPAYQRLHVTGTPAIMPTSTMFNLDVLSLLKGLVSGAAREAREQSARKEVKQAMDEYCAAQPNGGAGLPLCTDVSPDAPRR